MSPYLKFRSSSFLACYFWCSLCILSIQAQPRTDSVSVDLILETYLATFDDEQDIDEEVLAELQFLLQNPIDINQCDLESLLRIPFLDPLLAHSIIAFRDSVGGIQDLSALTEISRLSAYTLSLTRPFLKIGQPTTNPRRSENRKTPHVTFLQSYSRRIDLPQGFQRSSADGGFRGSPASFYSRLSVNYNNQVFARLTLEKDPGEAFEWSIPTNTYGFDHLTGSISVKGKANGKNTWFQQLILGDYAVLAGQGLLFWRNTSTGKGSLPLEDPLRNSAGIKPMASREENAFFRGAALSLNPLPKISLSAFYSNRHLDASITPSVDDKPGFISSLNKSGLHRTSTELSRKDAFQEQLIGSSISYQSTSFQKAFLHLGFTGYASQFSHLYTKGNGPDDLFDFAGQSLNGLSVNGQFRSTHLMTFFEAGKSYPGGHAITGGLLLNPHRSFRSLLLWRSMGTNFYSNHGNSFGEQRSTNLNEKGLYAAFEILFTKKWTTSFFVDIYEHPWLKTNTFTPTNGIEYFAKTTYKPRRWMQAALYYRYERKRDSRQIIAGNGQALKSTDNVVNQAVRLQYDFEFSNQLRLRSRVDVKKSTATTERYKGTLILQDIIWTPNKQTYLQVRFAMFDSEGKGATLYAYENDLRYRFTIRAFTGNGGRNFILLRRDIGTHLTLEVKYGTTRYGQTINTGAGADSFSGKLVREVQTQIILHV